ncbi:MAG: D-xylose transporter XylE [Mangrovibacterium sp.]
MKQQTNTLYIFGITLVATIGGLLFGYDTAVISGAEQSVQAFLITPLGLNSFVHGITTSSALIGCIIGAAISGYMASTLGRRKSLMIAALLFFISALGSGAPELLFFEKGVPTIGLLYMFNLYRVIGGIGVGLASAVCPMYIGEIAPANIRGRLVSFNQFAIIFGMLVVYFVNWGIASGKTMEWINEIGWRRMFWSEAIPAGLFGFLLFFVPESPRWLVLNKKEAEASKILAKINGVEAAGLILSEIKQTALNTPKNTKLFSYGKKVIIIGVLACFFQQFCGINVALYYAPRIFESMGAGRDASMLQTIVMGLVNVIFTVVAILTVDKFGRKPLLMIGSIGMTVGMFAIGGLAFAEVIGMSTLVFMIIYTASFMMSWGPVCWVLVSELFPNAIRGKATAIAVAFQWIANFLISATFPAMADFSTGGTYCFYGLMSLISFIFVWKMIPETKGKTLEEMEKLYR